MDLEKSEKRAVVQEGVHLVMDGNDKVIGMIRLDMISRKSLIYMVAEANCDDIATKIIK